jgi:hypothetical protein
MPACLHACLCLPICIPIYLPACLLASQDHRPELDILSKMFYHFKSNKTIYQLTGNITLFFVLIETCGQYHKHVTIVQDASGDIKMMIMSDATT